jgi:hypothetical protein
VDDGHVLDAARLRGAGGRDGQADRAGRLALPARGNRPVCRSPSCGGMRRKTARSPATTGASVSRTRSCSSCPATCSCWRRGKTR